MARLIDDGYPRTWGLSVDEEGYREYAIKFLVLVEADADGPLVALRTVNAEYPIGSAWNFVLDDADQWATRRPQTVVSIHEEIEGELQKVWAVECVYSNKPPKTGRCEGEETGNPLCIPDRVSGRFVKWVEEASQADSIEFYEDGVLLDAETGGGVLIRNSAWEQLRGPTVEFEKNRQRIVVEQNVLDLELELLAELVDTVNDADLWGFGNRSVKLSDVSWVKRYYGTATNVGSTGTGTGTDDCPDYSGCQSYYTRTLEFDIDYNGFVREVPDEATRVLNGHWQNVNSNTWVLDNIDGGPPDPTNPAHFKVVVDRSDNLSRMFLNGEGLPAGSIVDGDAKGKGTIKIYKFPAKNFLQLSLPTTI